MTRAPAQAPNTRPLAAGLRKKVGGEAVALAGSGTKVEAHPIRVG
jgi:hypothetical protein